MSYVNTVFGSAEESLFFVCMVQAADQILYDVESPIGLLDA